MKGGCFKGCDCLFKKVCVHPLFINPLPPLQTVEQDAIMSKLIQGMELIRETFFKYSEGQPTMTKTQVVQLLRKEMLGDVNNAEAEKLFELLDNDGSGTVDFKEFVTFVTAVSLLSC